jgi:uncharacterized protein (DUF305 family)
MRKIVLRRVWLPGAAALLALALTAGCGTDGDGDEGTATPTTGAGFNEADVAFTQNMLMHHQQALEMAEQAETAASDPELAELAAGIAANLEPEITTMTGWLTTWGEPMEPAGGHEGMSMPGMASEDEMAALVEASGVEFDRTFTRMMVAHHGGAVQMCQDVQSQGINVDVAGLAATIEQQQSDELETLEGILDQL